MQLLIRNNKPANGYLTLSSSSVISASFFNVSESVVGLFVSRDICVGIPSSSYIILTSCGVEFGLNGCPTDGYVFSKVSQYGTTTGRVSVSQPNYQSYNDPIKENVIPRPGFYMFDTDYSSVEYRVLGNMVGNKAIMHSFEDPDFDYHQYQAARMYGVPYASVTKKMRKAANGINFGLLRL